MKEEYSFGLTLLVTLALMLATEGTAKHHGKPTPSPSPTVTPSPTPTPPSPTPTPPPPTPTPTPIISVTLAWDPLADPSVQGYHLWKGTSPGAENMLAALVPAGNVTSAIVPVLSGTTYFVVTAYNPAGESLPSCFSFVFMRHEDFSGLHASSFSYLPRLMEVELAAACFPCQEHRPDASLRLRSIPTASWRLVEPLAARLAG